MNLIVAELKLKADCVEVTNDDMFRTQQRYGKMMLLKAVGNIILKSMCELLPQLAY